MHKIIDQLVAVPVGIIVLPCGAGKSLVGVAASARIKKSVLCLVTNSVSVDQWKHQFKLWTGLQDHQISRYAVELTCGIWQTQQIVDCIAWAELYNQHAVTSYPLKLLFTS